jgi:putative DNA primase/helicase
MSAAPGNRREEADTALAAPSREFATAVAEFWKQLGVGVAWTESNMGEGAKRVRDSWPKTAKAVNGDIDAAAGAIADRLTRKNPVVVAKPDDPSATAYILVDVDGPEDLDLFQSFELPPTLTARSSEEHKLHFYYLPPEGATKHRIRFEAGTIHTDRNGYLVTPPALHPSGVKYKWLDRNVAPTRLTRERYDALLTAAGEQDKKARASLQANPGEKIPKGVRRTRCAALAGALRRHAIPEKLAETTLLDFNREMCDPPMPDAEVTTLVRDFWQRYQPTDPDDLLFDSDVPAAPTPARQPNRRPELGEPGMADHFYRKYRERFLHINETEKWIGYHDDRWHETGSLKLVREAMKDTILGVYDEYGAQIDRDHADPDDVAYAEAAEKFVARHKVAIRTLRDNALNIAEYDFRCSLNQLDGDHTRLLLVCGNGVLDLETGNLREGSPRDLITVGTRVPYLPAARSVLWEDTFLPQAFETEEMIRFMQRFAGLCLSGLTSEERLYVFEGRGRNGKGTYLDALAAALGPDLAASIRFATLATSNRQETGSAPQADVMHVRGKRLIVASEKNESRALDEEKVKKWTGGDRITARAPYGKSDVEFVLHGKVVLAVNHLPHINASDAMRARLLRVPFRNQFLRERGNLDLTLKDRLKAATEVEGVLRWMVDGWREYQRIGLDPPAHVLEATNDYLARMNPLAEFIADRCEEDPASDQPSGELQDAYRDWLRDNPNERRLSDLDFTLAMESLGHKRRTLDGRRYWQGLRLRGAVL